MGIRRRGKTVTVEVHVDEYVNASINIDDLLADLSDEDFMEAAMKRNASIASDGRAVFGRYLEDIHAALLRGDAQEALCLFERAIEPAPKAEYVMAKYKEVMSASVPKA